VKHVSLVPSERSAIVFAFVIALSVGLAVSVLFFWHLYLVFTAQTTIEFYQNQNRRARARARGEVWLNPFDLGTESIKTSVCLCEHCACVVAMHSSMFLVSVSISSHACRIAIIVSESFSVLLE
jgi:hypothetical protein